MRLLLDTHALLWAMEDSPQLSERARNAVLHPKAEVRVSAVSAYELALKARLGRLPSLPQPLAVLIQAQGFTPLPVTTAHAELAGSLPTAIRDPWDRLLAAQSLLEGLTVVTRDPALAELGARVLW
jgi:PIN domain nuclease of toxin-antitoxin system